MNKTQTRGDAILELEVTNSIEILNNQLEEDEYRQIIERFKQTKSDFLKKTEEAGYSEFMSGVMLGLILGEENKRIKTRNWTPSFLRRE